MKKFYLILLFSASLAPLQLLAQDKDTNTYSLRLSQTLFDIPRNLDEQARFPSMKQSVDLSSNLYETGFWGINALGDKIFFPKGDKSLHKHRALRGLGNVAVQYGLGWAFSRYGSGLPIPLGEWAHEEYHRSVLGLNGISSKNGNWILNRWDGTVYGISDQQLSELKTNNLPQLLYSYVAGAHAENQISRDFIIQDVFYKHNHFKAPLYLYNAWYVRNYLQFSTSSISDSVKVLVPPHESPDPKQRDFAGADFTAWAWDMFNPNSPYEMRDSFPNGDGVNRRVGFSDLSPEAQAFLKKQYRLSNINFFNLALLGIRKIKIGKNTDFSFMMQYTPLHFGHEIAYYLPFRYKRAQTMLALHRYVNHEKAFWGVETGLWDWKPGNWKNISLNVLLQVWNQPEKQGFYDAQSKLGGSLEVQGNLKLNDHFGGFVTAGYKTEGWQMGNAYLAANYYARVGMSFKMVAKRK